MSVQEPIGDRDHARCRDYNTVYKYSYILMGDGTVAIK